MIRMADPLGTPFPVYAVTEASPFDAEAAPDFCFALDEKGWLVFRRNAVSTSLSRLEHRFEGDTAEEPFAVLEGTIPVEILNQAVSFFKAVYREHQSEAFAFLLHHPESGEWQLHVPDQEVSGASVDYEEAPPLEPGWVVAGDIHSHGSMSAFHSSVDDADELERDGIHVTVGNANDQITLSCSLVIQGVRHKLLAAELFSDLEETAPFPAEWLKRVAREVYTPVRHGKWDGWKWTPNSPPSHSASEDTGPYNPKDGPLNPYTRETYGFDH